MQDIERKGVDMVRRDWSLLSKEIGDLCLSKILYGGYVLKHQLKNIVFTLSCKHNKSLLLCRSCEDVVEAIHNELMKVIFVMIY